MNIDFISEILKNIGFTEDYSLPYKDHFENYLIIRMRIEEINKSDDWRQKLNELHSYLLRSSKVTKINPFYIYIRNGISKDSESISLKHNSESLDMSYEEFHKIFIHSIRDSQIEQLGIS